MIQCEKDQFEIKDNLKMKTCKGHKSLVGKLE